MKSASIVEGGLARQFRDVAKLKISRTDGELQEWIPQDEANVYIVTKEKKITQNGAYIARDDGCDAYKAVEVELPLDEKTITQDGTYTAADENLDGYSKVIVAVAHRVGHKKITYRGVFYSSSDGLEGYSSVEVKLTFPKKVITANGTYRSEPESPGFGEVEVNVPNRPSGRYPKPTYDRNYVPAIRNARADEAMNAFDTVLVYNDPSLGWRAKKSSSLPEEEGEAYLGFLIEQCNEGQSIASKLCILFGTKPV